MRVIVPGHHVDLDMFDRIRPDAQCLIFVQRVGDGYPGNKEAHPGTNCQEVLRGLIHRISYLNGQEADPRNADAIEHARAIIRLFEERAAERHGRAVPKFTDNVEEMPTCAICGHVECDERCRKKERK